MSEDKRCTETLVDVLDRHPESIRQLCHALRERIGETVPGLAERVNVGWHALAYHDAEGGYVFGIFPFDDRVQLLFEHGARLPDPDGLLAGADRKQIRYVVLRPGQRPRWAGLQRLLLAAIHEARLRRATGSAARRASARGSRK